MDGATGSTINLPLNEARHVLPGFILQTWYNPTMQTARIISDPQIMMGKPVVAGTRVTVETILERLSAGETTESIVEAFPNLTLEAVRAALAFAATALRADVVYPLPRKSA